MVGSHSEERDTQRLVFEGSLLPQLSGMYASEGLHSYRFPSLCVSNSGIVLAFASRRRALGGGGCESEIVFRRSLDGGRLFSPPKAIASQPGMDLRSGPVLLDYRAGRLLKFGCFWPAGNEAERYLATTPYGRLRAKGWIDHVIVSDDEGQSWQAPRPQPLPYPPDALACGVANGGHALQLADGRLLLQAGFCLGGTDSINRHNCLFYSADGGSSWRLGAVTSAPHSLRELALAQLGDSRLYAVSRAPGGACQVGYSLSRGETLTAFVSDPQLPAAACPASVIHVGARDRAHPATLVLASPSEDSPGAALAAPGTRRLVVMGSEDGGNVWNHAKVLFDTAAAHSDLAILPNGTIGCLFECGQHDCFERIAFARFSLDWLGL